MRCPDSTSRAKRSGGLVPERSGGAEAGDSGTYADALVRKTDLDPEEWTPGEMRHSFVSAPSAPGVPLEDISRLVGHDSTEVTETVSRNHIRRRTRQGDL